MGKGIDAARALAPEHAAVMEELRDQLLIVFLRKLGGKLSVTAEEIDATGSETLSFRLEGRTFHFTLGRKA